MRFLTTSAEDLSQTFLVKSQEMLVSESYGEAIFHYGGRRDAVHLDHIVVLCQH